MKIGVLGTGDVGRTLAAGFARRGHQVMIGTRNPVDQKVQTWKTETGAGAEVGTFAEAAAFGSVLILATRWEGTENAIRLAGPESFAGKVVIDATNPLDFSTGAPRLAVGHTDSGGEHVQRWLPGAHVVKAFNTVGYALMVDPHLPGGPPDLFICGDSPDAKHAAARLAAELGWPTIDVGGIEGARYLEPLAMLWVAYGFSTNTWTHAFKLLRR